MKSNFEMGTKCVQAGYTPEWIADIDLYQEQAVEVDAREFEYVIGKRCIK